MSHHSPLITHPSPLICCKVSNFSHFSLLFPKVITNFVHKIPKNDETIHFIVSHYRGFDDAFHRDGKKASETE